MLPDSVKYEINKIANAFKEVNVQHARFSVKGISDYQFDYDGGTERYRIRAIDVNAWETFPY